MPQNKRYRSGSAAAGGGMLVLWLTMQGKAWLEREWLSLLPETAAAGIELLLQLVMLGLPLVVILRLLRQPMVALCPLKRGKNGSLWLLPAGLAGRPQSSPAVWLSLVGAILLPAVMEELLFRGAVLHALRPAGETAAIWLSALLFMGAHGSLTQWLPALATSLMGRSEHGEPEPHLCNNVVAWLTTYHPSPVTTVILPAVLLIWGAVAVLMLRRLPRRLPQPGNIRQGMTVPLALALLLLLGNALLYPVH